MTRKTTLGEAVSDALAERATAEADRATAAATLPQAPSPLAPAIERLVALRAAEQVVRAHTPAEPAPQAHAAPPALSDLLDVIQHEQLADAQAERAQLGADIERLRSAADTMASQLAAAETAWKYTPRHSEADATRLEQLRQDVPATYATLDQVEQQAEALDARIADLTRTHEVEIAEARRQRVAEVVPPVIVRLEAAVSELLAALEQQQSTRERLHAEGCAPYMVAFDDLQLGVYDRAGDDDLTRMLHEWLAKAKQAS